MQKRTTAVACQYFGSNIGHVAQDHDQLTRHMTSNVDQSSNLSQSEADARVQCLTYSDRAERKKENTPPGAFISGVWGFCPLELHCCLRYRAEDARKCYSCTGCTWKCTCDEEERTFLPYQYFMRHTSTRMSFFRFISSVSWLTWSIDTYQEGYLRGDVPSTKQSTIDHLHTCKVLSGRTNPRRGWHIRR